MNLFAQRLCPSCAKLCLGRSRRASKLFLQHPTASSPGFPDSPGTSRSFSSKPDRFVSSRRNSSTVVSDTPPPGVASLKWWPRTQKGWDELDQQQLHAAEEARKRYGPPKKTRKYKQDKKQEKLIVKTNKLNAWKSKVKVETEQQQLKMGRDEIVPPSEASGGVPEPTAEYLDVSAQPSIRLETAQPLLVVVDLNGTMLHRPNSVRYPRKFIHRPYAAIFLNYCIKTFWVVVWSSARPENVKVMCENLASPETIKSKVVAVWGRDRFGLTEEDYMSRVQCYKRLTSLWENPEVAKSHPDYDRGGRWSQANTVLIDDSPEKARSEPYNIIIVPEFSNQGDAHEGILPTVHDFLNELCFESNVSSFMRANPFRPRNDLETLGSPAESLTFYHDKQAKRNKKKERKSYVYAPGPFKGVQK